MAGFNDKIYDLGVSMFAIASTGGTLAIPQAAGVIKRSIYGFGGTMYILGGGLTLTIGTSYGLFGVLAVAGTPFVIDGPAAFALIAGADTSSVQVVNHYSQSGRPTNNQAT